MVSTGNNSDEQKTQGTKCVDSERLAEIRRQIQSGEYETPEKLAATVTRVAAELRRMDGDKKVSREGGSGGERP